MAFNFTDSSNIGKEYKGFILLAIHNLQDFKSQAVYLRHKTTGLEIYHIINDDNENLFSFAFRTLANNSKGAAHIIEHSVLCGSEKFPLKEPFSTLESQSVKTFLNAMTYPDKTAYPAASLVKSDYFNLMDVYADAVFFPLLSEQTFMQEGHRFELDESDGEKLSIQGVVYNEMKANYASFNAVATDLPLSKMYAGSVYNYDSGGDPLEIPELSYEEFRAFHKKFYNPSNCLLFLYGDIPTETQIDFICEKYISRLENKFGTVSLTAEQISNPLPILTEEIKSLQKITRFEKSFEYRDYAPDVGATGEMVGISWYTGESNGEKLYLNEILLGNDSSPVTIALKESKLGDDLAPLCGNFGQFPQENIFTLGLTGVKKKNEEKVRKLIFKTIKEVYEKGIPEADIDSAIMGIDFSLREVNRYFGPFSLTLMSKVLSGWAYGYSVDRFLSPITDFENLKKKIRSEKDFTKNLIKKYLIDNEKNLFFVIEPTEDYIKQRSAKEKKLIEKVSSQINKEELKKQLDDLHSYQQKKETDEELNCIPHLRIDDLDKNYEHTKDYIPTEFFEVPGINNQKIPVIFNNEKTNGLVYLELCFPIDNIPPEEYKNLPLFSETVTELGWNKKNWTECFTQANCITGDLWATVLTGTFKNHPDSLAEIEKYENKNLFGRNFVCLSTKFLTEKTEAVFDLMAEIVTTMNFEDKKRFSTILTEYKADKKANFLHSAASYLSSRLKAYCTKAAAINEIFYGFTQCIYADELKKSQASSLLKSFKNYYQSMLESGCVIHVTADEDSLAKVKTLLSKFVVDSKLNAPSEHKNYTLEDYTAQIYVPKDYNSELNREICKISTQSGFAAMATECSSWPSKENTAEDVLCNYLDNHDLWQKIRMTGGAYGAGCSADGTSKMFRVVSWRDPTPAKTLQTFMEILEDVAKNPISAEDVERTVISCYSDKIVPDSPSVRGGRGFSRFVYGTTRSMLETDFENILSVKTEDVTAAAKRINDNAKTNRKEILICDNSVDICGNFIKIEL